MDNSAYKRGSRWRKWDLHVHTPNTKKNDQYSPEDKNKWDLFCNKIKNSDVEIIGVTDYFSIKNYYTVVEKFNIKFPNSNKQFFPNIELATSDVVNKAAEEVNIHLIFNPKIKKCKLQEFLENLKTNKTDQNRREIKASELTSRGDYEEATTKRDYIRKAFKETFGKEAKRRNYFLVFSAANNDGIRSSGAKRKNVITDEIDKFSDGFFGGSQNREHFLDTNRLEESNRISPKPVVSGSDAHSFKELDDKLGKSYSKKDDEGNIANSSEVTWIKANPTFEGLKQILYEPNDRVKIQKQRPGRHKNIHSISSIEIRNSRINPNLAIEEEKILLNKNLVVITGGKGNGKTALLDLIANNFQDRCSRGSQTENRNSFIRRIQGEANKMETKLTFLGEDVANFKKKIVDEKFVTKSKITYLPQGEISELSADNVNLVEQINGIIFEQKHVKEKNLRKKFLEKREEISEVENKISRLNREINKIKQETEDSVFKKLAAEIKQKKGSLLDKQENLKELTKDFDEGIKEELAEEEKEKNNLRNKLEKLNHLANTLKGFIDELNSFQKEKNKRIREINKKLHNHNLIKVENDVEEIQLGKQISFLEKVKSKVAQKIECTKENIENLDTQIEELSGVKQTHTDLIEEINNLKKEISELEEKQDKLKAKKEKAENLEQTRVGGYLSLIQKHWELEEIYKNAIDVFSKDMSEILSGIEFRPKITFDRKKFQRTAENLLDQRKINSDTIEDLSCKLENIVTKSNGKVPSKKLESLSNSLLGKRDIIKGEKSREDLYKWVFANYFSLEPQIFFQGTHMDKLSMGQKGMVLLKLFLAEGDYPLIIDQPEENLDNKFIYEELKEAFREAKKERQIIIATNNANLVVNTDAEQIIIAEFSENKISYSPGSIEDSSTRETIMPILEGGEEAFREREKKYGMG